MGANTLRTGNPEMLGTKGILSPGRMRAIISRSGSIPVIDKKLFRHGPQPFVFTGEDNMFALQNKLEGPEGPYGLSLQAAIDFFADRGLESVLIEGGAQLNYAALAEGVVDEILLTIMPFISGEQGAAAFADGPKRLGEPFLELEILSSIPVSSGELFLHYRVKRME
jgi:riboflavin biosynthesis pyrimidine reductase